MRRPVLPFLLLALLSGTPAAAHVGSPNVFYDGAAGPYPVRVIVRAPVVVPGLAEITVRIQDGRRADEVSVQPIQWKAGAKGAPPADVATPVPGAPATWSAQLWLMTQSSYSVRVRVKGPAGEGEALVPVTAAASRILRMQSGLGTVLAFLGVFLFAGAVSLVGAATRESVLAPGEIPDDRRRRRARTVTVLAALFLALVLWGGKRWWDSVDGAAQEEIFKPFQTHAAARIDAGRPVLDLQIVDPRQKDWTPLMPDHGKLMHLFLVREPGLDAFAHLHPLAAAGQREFVAALPALPAGAYRVYADVVHESGFPQTLVDRVTLPAAAGTSPAAAGPAADPDDSWRTAEPLERTAVRGPRLSRLEDGGTMLWHQEPLAVDREATLRFEVRAPDGRPALLEPYMGMRSHAVITRDDGKVFVHLHPMGSISMAAQEAFTRREREEGTAGTAGTVGMEMAGMDHGLVGGSENGTVSFPYAFPQPGRYRIWVQVKSGGRVLTGVFDTVVGSSA
jgi:hypothetical protein